MPNSDNPVFLCADDDDMETAKQLYDDLKSEGISTWMESEDLLPGKHCEQTPKQAIRKSRSFLALLSSKSVAKRGFIQKKLKAALDVFDEFAMSDIFIIPIRIDECDLPDELAQLKSVDLFKAPYQDCLKQLLKVLPKIIPPESACTPGHFTAHLGDPNQKGLLPPEERLSQIIPGQNPYITGTPLPGNSPVFFGREQILHEILSALRKPGKPACISLLGERRIGKSSLLNQICQFITYLLQLGKD